MRFLFFAFIFIGLIHLGNLFYGPVIKNNMLEGKMIQLSQEHRMKADMYMLKDLATFIEDNHIELDPKQIAIQHPTAKSVVISAKYDVFCKFWFLEKAYAFEPRSDAADHRVIPDFRQY
jgi:hypothetical protein